MSREEKSQPTDELMKSCSGDDWSQEQNYESQSEYLGSDTSSRRSGNIKKEIPCMIIYTTLLERERERRERRERERKSGRPPKPSQQAQGKARQSYSQATCGAGVPFPAVSNDSANNLWVPSSFSLGVSLLERPGAPKALSNLSM